MKTFKQILPLIAAMAGLLIFFGLWVENFLTLENMLDLVQQISVNAILAFGMTLVILIGGIDLSVGALLALVGTTTVYILTRGQSDTQSYMYLTVAILGGLGVAAGFGIFNGICAAKTKMPPFIITLAMMLVARGSASAPRSFIGLIWAWGIERTTLVRSIPFSFSCVYCRLRQLPQSWSADRYALLRHPRHVCHVSRARAFCRELGHSRCARSVNRHPTTRRRATPSYLSSW